MSVTNIVRAVVKPGSNYTVTSPIMKEDKGQILLIEGLDLPEVYEIDFSNDRHHGTSVTMIGNADGVLIPTQFIKTGRDVFAFYYYVGDNFGQTEHVFRLPNDYRPDRTEEVPEPEQESLIEQAISALNSAVAQTAQDVQTTTQKASEATESARSASISERNAADSAETAVNAKNAAEGSAEDATSAKDQAVASAISANESANTASIKASEASTNAITASVKADEARASAASALNDAGIASMAAGSASSDASNAQTSANTASSKAAEASTSAQTASTKASEANQSAVNASASASQAESAKTASQTAQGLAESARDLAQGYANDAQASAESISASASQIAQNTSDIASLEADIYKPYATDTASGAIASFPDGADDIPLKSLVVDIDPVQDLHGYDSPWVGGGGKNKFFADGSIDAYLASDGVIVTGYAGWKLSDYIPVKADTTYTFNPNTSEGVSAKLGQYDSEKTMLGFLPSGKRTFTTPSNCTYMRFSYRDTSTDIQLEEGSTATEYAPYENICPISGWTGCNVNANGTVIPISWADEAGTVYGGKLDVLSGKLTLTNYFCTPDNATRIIYGIDSQSNLPYAYFQFAPKAVGTSLSARTLCSMYKAGNAQKVDKALRMWGSEADIWDSDLDVTSLDTVKAYFADLVIVYPLETPIEIQLSPTEVNSLLGQNNIFADTGDTACEYRADTKLYINRLTEPDADMIADSNIVSGQYFMVGNSLYIATANIANGGAIVVGTNCTRKSLSEALNEINA